MTVKANDRKSMEAFLTKAGWVVASPSVRKASFTDAVADFQRAYNLGTKLVVDGIPGVKTAAAANKSAKNGYRVSKNFQAKEFLCGCKGKRVGCRSIRVTRQLLRGLEKVRTAHFKATGLAIVSGYRCPSSNASVGGRVSPPSHHVTGQAVDIPRKVKAGHIKAAWGFRGIGVTSWDKGVPSINSRRVVHLDMGEARRVVFQE